MFIVWVLGLAMVCMIDECWALEKVRDAHPTATKNKKVANSVDDTRNL
jgi:hypothetical protein